MDDKNYLLQFTKNQLPTVEADAAVFEMPTEEPQAEEQVVEQPQN